MTQTQASLMAVWSPGPRPGLVSQGGPPGGGEAGVTSVSRGRREGRRGVSNRPRDQTKTQEKEIEDAWPLGHTI